MSVRTLKHDESLKEKFLMFFRRNKSIVRHVCKPEAPELIISSHILKVYFHKFVSFCLIDLLAFIVYVFVI